MRVLPLIAALLAQAVLWFWDLRLLPVWGDEQFTLHTVALPWSEIAGTLERDIHPPLYYFVLKLWLAMWPSGVEPIVAARAFSACCALGATVALDRLWLTGVSPRARALFLALWTLSPCLLLYSRMARSYSMQLLLAALAIEAAVRWLESKRPAAAIRFAAAEALLLYTHYLPGLAIGAAAGLLGLRRAPRQAAAAGGLIAMLYLPWAAVLWAGLGKAAVRDAYTLTQSSWTETALRLGFTGVSFLVGEAVNLTLLGVAIVGAPAALLLAAYAGWKEPSVRATLVAAAAVVAYLGATQWVSYPFVPARLLFLLPYVLFGVAWAIGRRPRLGLALATPLLLGAIAGQALYREQSGFLNKGYLIPYGEIAERIMRESQPSSTLILADAFNGDPKPLRAALPASYRILEATATDFPDQVAQSTDEANLETIWTVRAARDISPTRVHRAVEEKLAQEYRVTTVGYLPYSSLERALLTRLGGEPAATHHFQVGRWTLQNDPNSPQ